MPRRRRRLLMDHFQCYLLRRSHAGAYDVHVHMSGQSQYSLNTARQNTAREERREGEGGGWGSEQAV